MSVADIKFLSYDDLTIAGTYQSWGPDENSASFPMTLLMYVEKGSKVFEADGRRIFFPQGSFLLIRKFTDGTFYTELDDQEQLNRCYAFALTDALVRPLIKDFMISTDLPPVKERIVKLEKNDLLENLMASVKSSFEGETEFDKGTLTEMTKQAIMAIIKADPALAAVFQEYTRAERVDLAEFMNRSYLLRMPLKVLAMQSGRSLSTFHRDFKMVFGETPHKWIMRKRLNTAKHLLANEEGTPSEIYIQVGFEDLAHFSRAFKKQFGYPPSQTPVSRSFVLTNR